MIGQQKSYMHRNVLNTDDFFVGGIFFFFLKDTWLEPNIYIIKAELQINPPADRDLFRKWSQNWSAAKLWFYVESFLIVTRRLDVSAGIFPD